MVIVGLFRAEIKLKRRITTADVYVASGKSGSLLSYQTALDLDLVTQYSRRLLYKQPTSTS